MRINTRNLNDHEQYACEVKDVKKVFSNQVNLSISFGFLNRYYKFDSAFVKRPNINGIIILSLQVNKRLKVIDSYPILSFYVIRDEKYDIKSKKHFAEFVLPQVYEWYINVLSNTNTLLPGVKVFLVEWTGIEFKTHACRYS